MYQLIGADGKAYMSAEKGRLGGHRKLKIYGRLDCPSALRHIAAGAYIQHRVFFADEQTALAAGYRPCGVCMKEHYNLWKGGKLMDHALDVTPVLAGDVICTVGLANGETKCFTTAQVKDTPIPEKIKEGIEDYKLKIEDDYCVIVLTAERYQWGYTLVWDYVRDRVVHLSSTPFAVDASIVGDQVVDLYLVQYWGHPADLHYSSAPLEKVDAAFEPSCVPLSIVPDETVKDSSCCEVCQKNGSVFFRVGGQEEWLPEIAAFSSHKRF